MYVTFVIIIIIITIIIIISYYISYIYIYIHMLLLLDLLLAAEGPAVGRRREEPGARRRLPALRRRAGRLRARRRGAGPAGAELMILHHLPLIKPSLPLLQRPHDQVYL